jgi:hypothetical protein
MGDFTYSFTEKYFPDGASVELTIKPVGDNEVSISFQVHGYWDDEAGSRVLQDIEQASNDLKAMFVKH